jgi:hypothetical protein
MTGGGRLEATARAPCAPTYPVIAANPRRGRHARACDHPDAAGTAVIGRKPGTIARFAEIDKNPVALRDPLILALIRQLFFLKNSNRPSSRRSQIPGSSVLRRAGQQGNW